MSNTDLRLWGVGTARTLRPIWMMAELDLDYDLRPIGPRTGETRTEEYLRLNPKHKVPVLEHGPLVLSESAAIITYLSETFPPPPGLHVPGDAERRAVLNEWNSFILMELDAHPLYLIRRHKELSHIYGEAPHAVRSAEEYFCEQIDCIMKRLGDSPVTLMPEGFSVADILFVTCLSYALSLEIPLPEPLIAYRQRLIGRPAYRRAYEINFPDRSPGDLR